MMNDLCFPMCIDYVESTSVLSRCEFMIKEIVAM